MTIDIIAVKPPPLTGMTHVTGKISVRLDREGLVGEPGFSSPIAAHGLRWKVVRQIGMIGALLRASLKSRGRHSAYVVPDSKSGLWVNLILTPILRLAFRRIYLHHHVFSYISRRDRRMALLVKVLGRRARHILLAPTMSAGLQRHYGQDLDIVLQGNACFVDDAPKMRVRKTLKTIGFIGNITRNKGIVEFMQTIRALDQHGDFDCQIAGPIGDASLLNDVEAFVGEKRTNRVWLGPTYGEDKRRFFDTIDLLLFPTRYANEALPVTIYEALAAGIPVLATDRGCIRNQLDDLPWVFEEAQFVDRATDAIGAWAQSDEQFSAASRSAFARFETQRETDRRALDYLCDHMRDHDNSATGNSRPQG